MSKEQANTFRKFRDADDPQGNLGWSARMARKAMRQAPETALQENFEADYSLNESERIIWRLLKIPRKYIDLENLGVLPADKVRAALRGLVAADAVDILELAEAKPIVPLEVKRIRDKLAGKTSTSSAGASKLRARVFRPDIGEGFGAGTHSVGGPQVNLPPVPVQQAPPPKPATPDGPVELTAEGKLIVDLVKQLEKKLADNDHYAFLGVSRNVDAAAIKKAYMQRARELHPDRVMSSGAGNDANIRVTADVLFKALQNVYSVLNDARKRAEYDADLQSGAVQVAPGKKQRRPEEAKLMLKKGTHLLQSKQFKEAHNHLKMAIEFDEHLQEAQVLAAWALYYRDDKPKEERSSEARRVLKKLADEKDDAEAAYKLSLIARMEDHDHEHEKRVRQAVRLNPNHREATQELRVLDRRRNSGAKDKAAEKKGSLLDRLKR